MPDPRTSNSYVPLGWQPQMLGGPTPVMSDPGMEPGGFNAPAAPDTFAGSAPYYHGAPANINSWGDVQALFGQLMTLFSGPNLFDVQMGAPGGMPGYGMPPYNMPMPGGIPPGLYTPGGQPSPGQPSGRPGVATLPKNPDGVPVRIIEVGSEGKPDQHSDQVSEIYGHTLGNDGANANVSILGAKDNGKLPPGGVDLPKEYKTQKDLDQFIDFKGTYVLSHMAQEIKDTKSGMINASFGWTRESTYMDVISVLQENPALAKNMGLTEADIKKIKFVQTKGPDGKPTATDEIDLNSIPANVKSKVTAYVDKRLDQPNSAYNQALKLYQNEAHAAATQRNVAIVVASANDGKYRKVFTTATKGADANFLALSHDVIVVAASDTRGTPSLKDDKIADFSSRGVGEYTPTIAAKGVDIPTSYGLADGTSFASPYVAAVVTRMLQANPKLTPEQIKKILQKSAVNTNASKISEGAGMLDANKALQLAQQQAA